MSTLISDALSAGQFVLVVYAATESQTTQARQTIGKSMVADDQAPRVELPTQAIATS